MSTLSRTLLARRAPPSMITQRFAPVARRGQATAAAPAATRPAKVYPPPPRRPGEPDWTKMPDRRFMGKKWFPGMMAKPLYPFAIAAVIMIFVIDRIADKLMDTDEWRDDPRNPRRRSKPSDQ